MKREEFLFDVSGLSAYTEEPAELIQKAIASARTMQFVTHQTGIKSAETLNLIDSTITFAAGGTCGFSASGNDPITQRTITVCAVKVNKTYCMKTLEAYFTQKLLSPGSTYDNDSVPQAFVDEALANMAFEVEKLLWLGNATGGVGNLGMCDGFNFLVDASTGAVRVSSGTAWLTNEIETVYQMTSNIPVAIRDRSDLYLFMGRDMFDQYQKEVFDLNNRWLAPVDGVDGMALYSNVPIVVVNGLNGTTRMMLTYKENMYVGQDLENEEEQVDLWFSKDDDIHKMKIEFKIGVQFAFPEFVVYFNS